MTSELDGVIRELNSYTVSGLIVDDPNGPRRWCETIEASDPYRAELEAKARVWAMVNDGHHGVLFVANVFKGDLKAQDTYAVYGDDPNRKEGESPAQGWRPPPGFEGLD